MKNILVIFGGCSAEHEVSVRSARNVIAALDKEHFRAISVGVSRSGTWYLLKYDAIPDTFTKVTDDIPEENICSLVRMPKETIIKSSGGKVIKIDAAFPVIHGPMGEDGTLQGLFEMMQIPYVGPGVLGSAIAMDKDIFKKLLVNANILVVPFITVCNISKIPSYKEIVKSLNSEILFIKPAVMGSSVGVHKAKSEEEYVNGLKEAFKYSFKVLIEKYIPGREIECSVLGNKEPKASCIGELKPRHEFYSYEAKYLDPDGAEYFIPAKNVDKKTEDKIRNIAVEAFKAGQCVGMARADFFLGNDGAIYVNEINTIPGFTSISMYPKMWEASGIGYSELMTQLLLLAQEEFDNKKTLCLEPDII
jgi:D-alanine-D-alanine ligase